MNPWPEIIVQYVAASRDHLSGDLDASVADYSTVLRIEPDHVEATFHRGTVYEKLTKLDEAIDDFTKVLSLEPDHVKASYARGTCRNLKGDFAPAIGMLLRL